MLSLTDKINIELTREEMATLCIAVGLASDELDHMNLGDNADRLVAKLQAEAPVGVIVRVMQAAS